jgi:fibronectin type III domain protein
MMGPGDVVRSKGGALMKTGKIGLLFISAALALLTGPALVAQDQTPDTQAPAVPTGLAVASVTSSSITITWNASTDDVGVTEYRVYRRVVTIVGGRGGGTRIHWDLVAQGIMETTATIGGLAPSTSRTLAVTARDAAGNESLRSASIQAITLPPPPPSEQPPPPGTPYAVTDEPFLFFVGATLEPESSTSLVSAPDGAVFDDETGFILWTPSSDQLGMAAFIIRTVADEGTFDQHLGLPVYPLGSDLLPASLLPDAPLATAITSDGCTLAWSPSTDPGAAGYKVIAQEALAGASPFIAADTGGPLTAIDLTGLAPDTAYYLWVVEYDEFNGVPPNGASPSVLIQTLPSSPPAPFIRGDSTGDGKLNLADVVMDLSYLYAGGARPGCLAAANANGSEGVDISDAIFLLWFLFEVGPAPVPPFPACGLDPSAASPGCASYPGCP